MVTCKEKTGVLQLFLLLLLSWVLLLAQPLPMAYETLALAIQEQADQPYENVDVAKGWPYKELRSCLVSAFDKGYELEEAIITNASSMQRKKSSYLKALRQCESLSKELQRLHSKALYEAMERNDYEQFLSLVQLTPPKRLALQRDLLGYYEAYREDQKSAYLEYLRSEAKIERQSREQMAEEYAAYEEHIKVLAREEAERLRKMTAPSKRNNVVISTEKEDEGYRFSAQNFNPFTVTVTLGFKALENFTPDRKVPLHFELKPKSEISVLNLMHNDRTKQARFDSYFGWVMGSAKAKHDDSVIYRVPFAKGSRVYVSQGFDGKVSHKNKKAVDFAVPIGTPIYAARSGRVIATQSAHSKGKFDRSYGKYANYIIIEHSDGTLANYYHLNKNGVVVKVGDEVEMGEHIGYSGNTGYTSGPHLHFSVSKVDPNVMNRPKTIAIRFKNGRKVVSKPKKGDVFTVE